MGTIVGNILRSIVNLFNKLTGEAKKALALAVIIVNAVKSLVGSPDTVNIFDYIVSFVETQVGPVNTVWIEWLHKKLHEILPKLLLDTTLLNEVANTSDPIEKEAKLNEFLLKAIVDLDIKWSTDEQKQMFFDGGAKQIAVVVSDGKITIAEILGLTNYVYTNLEKLKAKIL